MVGEFLASMSWARSFSCNERIVVMLAKMTLISPDEISVVELSAAAFINGFRYT